MPSSGQFAYSLNGLYMSAIAPLVPSGEIVSCPPDPSNHGPMQQRTSNTMLRSGSANGTTFIDQFSEWWESIIVRQEGKKSARRHGRIQAYVQGMEEA